MVTKNRIRRFLSVNNRTLSQKRIDRGSLIAIKTGDEQIFVRVSITPHLDSREDSLRETVAADREARGDDH